MDYEKLGLFYLGRRVPEGADGPDPAAPILLDARDLTTHAVCVGMTGSGKTGLCLDLLEEAAIDGIPAIAIDPKGDLGNLLLSFPELRPEDFRPWVDPDEARRQGIDEDALAARTAATWRDGLARWDQDGSRITRMRAATEFALYTPGGTFGRPLSILRSFSAPSAPSAGGDAAESATGLVSSLLALLGLDDDPLRSREHAFLSSLLLAAWEQGRDMSLADLVREIAQPPISHVGVLDLETFFPAAERMALSLRVNNLLASPGFFAWMEGEPLDVARLLYTPEGRPRLSILSIAHLDDAERMFFVSLLLGEVLRWVRRQPGTSSLRALLYMDEIFGYFPPTANPPSKPLMLALLKQARAFGLGVVLSTQNPVDLDYKGLANAGTWFLGRLQTERDRERMLDGLQGAAGGGVDRARLAALVTALRSRRFLLHSVRAEEPVVFESRWALSYLAGPLARPQIERLAHGGEAETAGGMEAGGPREGAAAGRAEAPAFGADVPGRPATGDRAPGGPATGGATPAGPATHDGAPGGRKTAAPATGGAAPARSHAAAARPVLPPEVPELLLPAESGGGPPTYRPHLFGSASVHYVSARHGVDEWARVALLVPLREPLPANPWEADAPAAAVPEMLAAGAAPAAVVPPADARFDPLPPAAARPKSYATWTRAFATHLYQSRPLPRWTSPELKLVSTAEETEGEFRVRASLAAREARDAAVEKIRRRYATKLQSLQVQLRRAEERVAREQSQLEQQRRASTIQIGATVLGALLGGRRRGLGGLATAARGASRARQESEDIVRATQEAEVLRTRLTALQGEVEREVRALQESAAAGDPAIAALPIAPRKADITVERVALVWMP